MQQLVKVAAFFVFCIFIAVMFNFKYKEYDFKCDIGMMTPYQYIRLINLLEEYLPNRICELGSGQSTNIFKKFCEKNNSLSYSIENDVQYNKYDSIMMPLIENTSLGVADKVYDRCTIYDGLESWLLNQDKFDFVFVDAPNDGIPFNTQGLKYARIQLFDFVLLDKLNDASIVMYHDSERDVSQHTLNEFECLLKENEFMFDKEVVVEKDVEIYEYNKKILGVCPELTIYYINKKIKF